MINLFPGVALVIGGASGIGQATAISFIREGCRKIVIADLNEDGLEATARLIQEADEWGDAQVESVKVNVADEVQVQALLNRAVQVFGRIDYAVNAAGTLSRNTKSHETAPAEFDRINSVNYRGCWLASRAQITQMLKQEPLDTHDGRPGNRGSIVNFASQLGIVGRPAAAAYCASKAAIISMTKCDAIDYSKDNIRVNCICPGVIETPMTIPNMDVLGPAIAIAPLNRAGTAQEVADAVLFVSSSRATFIQGSALVVDGGYTIN
ncbi:hypothetical protein DOTSEDRAFT_71891 [Dothistroma septosporum NZE10]|uniref:Versicolorin reductase 1 n=1 Tax=Dothistroma septosporum (strain NZE10 / CBS 128990) TaxID=675120 RepID=N1PP42_DOTSN|nr:hypothetical protein DOTSEDRAFT_71891 [Dothistroma septosporum NZE10]